MRGALAEELQALLVGVAGSAELEGLLVGVGQRQRAREHSVRRFRQASIVRAWWRYLSLKPPAAFFAAGSSPVDAY